MLGADHHGYIGRLKAAAAALGDDPAVVEVLIGQMVNLVAGRRAGADEQARGHGRHDGGPGRRGRRRRRALLADPLVGGLARSTSTSTCSAGAATTTRSSTSSTRTPGWRRSRATRPTSASPPAREYGLLEHPREGDLIRTLGEFPAVVASAAELREPHRVARYLEALASAYHKFYDACRVLPMGDEETTELHRARLALCDAARQVLANGLGMLGVSAPERM